MNEKLEKLVNDLSQLSITEATNLAKKLEEKWGVTAAFSALTHLIEEKSSIVTDVSIEESTEFDIIIKDSGAKKIDVIKVIRELTSLGLGEAKALSETSGAKVLSAVSKDAALDAKRKLEEAGAEIDFQLSALSGDSTTNAPPPKKKQKE